MNNHRIILTDVTMRDGMHAMAHQFSTDDMTIIAQALDEAGMDIIEVTHGDGLGGHSLQYGLAKHTDAEYLEAVSSKIKNAKLSVLLIPGIGTIHDLKAAMKYGIKTVRVCTHCTEADVSAQHIAFARENGLDTVGFLMMCHMISPAELVKQAKLMESYGANCVYATDSSGNLTPAGVTARISALREALSPAVQVGFHAHENLSLSVANSIAAIEAGAGRIDVSLAGLGAGAGNTPAEALVAVCRKLEIPVGADLYKLADAADKLVRPRMTHPVQVDGKSLMVGYAGVYSSFLLHAERAAARYGVDTRDILLELGRRKMVGGQEDMIIDVALDIANHVR
ncbi:MULTISPECIES: 4-hydroxy-2-oxovalerate aldolase [Sporomusa]|uniref:4-hydroxy-2-oxovalerate aldolase n=1 Tax=Sporomusa TaxID=2375 RepID=UPI00166495F2|nr:MULTISPECIES: 4-hydroxy-2-oxovalerate aldolase [Sporomusa]MCM0759907.1 4-hydroxy-2-oxovalerate aldolase [Sporomusa sphaeroides DSM 2875]